MLSPLFRLALGILLLLLAVPLPSRAAEAIDPARKAEVEKIIHDYFLEHPEFMIEVLRAAEAKVKEEKSEDAKQLIAAKKDELLNDATSPVGGNPDGDVTIVEFFDYRCPYCKQVEPSLETLLKEDGKIRIVYKEFPVLGPASVYASRVALAARKQGKYAAFHDAMMAKKGQITEEVVLAVAKAAGVDLDRAKVDMNAPEINDIIARNKALATDLEIGGTPTFIIGSRLMPGAGDIDALRKMVATARKSG
jgi:protein-disulfide isomerase